MLDTFTNLMLKMQNFPTLGGFAPQTPHQGAMPPGPLLGTTYCYTLAWYMHKGGRRSWRSPNPVLQGLYIFPPHDS